MNKRLVPLLHIAIAIILLISAWHLTEWLFAPRELNLGKYFIRSVLLVASIPLLLAGIVKLSSTTSNFLLNGLGALIGGSYAIFVLLEISFSFMPISCGNGTTLVDRNWFNYFWTENELGFRDESPLSIDRPDKKNILIVGDSFVAGHGINKEANRTSNILRNRLNNCYDVFNLGVNAADINDAYEFVTTFPVKPDILVVSHLTNDIDDNVIERTDFLKEIIAAPVIEFKPMHSDNYIFKNSFFLNFCDFALINFKWSIFEQKIKKNLQDYQNLIKDDEINMWEILFCINDSIYSEHFAQVNKLINYSLNESVPVVFIIYPDLPDVRIDRGILINAPLLRMLDTNEIPYIDTAPFLKSITQKQRTVNRYDSHPSAQANLLVAKYLEEHLSNSSLIDKSCSK